MTDDVYLSRREALNDLAFPRSSSKSRRAISHELFQAVSRGAADNFGTTAFISRLSRLVQHQHRRANCVEAIGCGLQRSRRSSQITEVFAEFFQ